MIISADAVALAEIVNVFTPLIGAVAPLVLDTLNVNDEVSNADVALMPTTKLAVPPADMSTGVFSGAMNAVPFHCRYCVFTGKLDACAILTPVAVAVPPLITDMNIVTGVPTCAFLLFGVMEETSNGAAPVTDIEPLESVGVIRVPLAVLRDEAG